MQLALTFGQQIFHFHFTQVAAGAGEAGGEAAAAAITTKQLSLPQS